MLSCPQKEGYDLSPSEIFKDSLPEVGSKVIVTPGLTSWGSKGKTTSGTHCLQVYYQAPGDNLTIITSFSMKLC